MTRSEHRHRSGSYVPALSIPALTRFYDTVLRATMRERTFKAEFIREANIQSGHRVLDLGCGTGTLAVMLKQVHSSAVVTGLDGDQEVLRIAGTKTRAAGVEVTLRRGLVFEPPYPPKSFDRVLSSLVFHHLTLEDKRRAFRAVRSLLVPGGELHVADWGRAQNTLMRGAFLSIQLLDGFETTRDNIHGRLPELMQEAGFERVEETLRQMTLFGTLAFYRGEVP